MFISIDYTDHDNDDYTFKKGIIINPNSLTDNIRIVKIDDSNTPNVLYFDEKIKLYIMPESYKRLIEKLKNPDIILKKPIPVTINLISGFFNGTDLIYDNHNNKFSCYLTDNDFDFKYQELFFSREIKQLSITLTDCGEMRNKFYQKNKFYYNSDLTVKIVTEFQFEINKLINILETI